MKKIRFSVTWESIATARAGVIEEFTGGAWCLHVGLTASIDELLSLKGLASVSTAIAVLVFA